MSSPRLCKDNDDGIRVSAGGGGRMGFAGDDDDGDGIRVSPRRPDSSSSGYRRRRIVVVRAAAGASTSIPSPRSRPRGGEFDDGDDDGIRVSPTTKMPTSRSRTDPSIDDGIRVSGVDGAVAVGGYPTQQQQQQQQQQHQSTSTFARRAVVNPYAKQQRTARSAAAAPATTATTAGVGAAAAPGNAEATTAARPAAAGQKRPRTPEPAPQISPKRVLFGQQHQPDRSSFAPHNNVDPPPMPPPSSHNNNSSSAPTRPTHHGPGGSALPPRPSASSLHGRPQQQPTAFASSSSSSRTYSSNHAHATGSPFTAAASPSSSNISMKVRSSPSATTETISVSAASDPRQHNLPKKLQFHPHSAVPPGVDADRRDLVRHAALSSPLANGWKLFSHQKRAVLFGLKQRRSILALDMGTGKTIIGCVWAKAFHRTFDCRIVILCPVSLKENWERTAVDATSLTVESPKASGHVSIASWASVPPPMNCTYVVVADEAHSMQSMAAKRTQQALQLMDHRNCLGALLLTGTPLKNGRPSNLFPLLKAVRHPLAKCQQSYEEYFCEGQHRHVGRNKPVWQANGAAHLDQLRQLVSSHVLYTSKDDVLKDLPPQTRVKHKVPVSAQRQAQHMKALQELAQLVNAQSAGAGSTNDPVVLGAIQKLRMAGSVAKIDAAVQLAVQVLEKEPAVVIFSSFVDVIKAIHKQLKSRGWDGELLTGETQTNKRQAMVDRFQRGEAAVFCCTYGAGGVGLTLTAAATVILVDRPWTPGDVNQAEGTLSENQPASQIIASAPPHSKRWLRLQFCLCSQIGSVESAKPSPSPASGSARSSSTTRSMPCSRRRRKLPIRFWTIDKSEPAAVPPKGRPSIL
jgi:superfamily II DNA or RNA helicase